MDKAKAIIDTMMSKDAFSQWLGIERLEEAPDFCKLRMIVRPEMCNGFQIAHGGITYSLADSALAFASNSHGKQAVSIETSISHIRPLVCGDVIIAAATQKSATNKIAVYEVVIQKENAELVALFKGTVYIKDKEW
ncbi:MAG: phenylacetic acid degradation protein PaaD [Segetibacter sp.]|nr:phenylacetic acid degradation protein PaaD [Segetibacter sp.]